VKTQHVEISLVDRLLAGDRAALAGAISIVEADQPEAAALLQALYPRVGHALVVGVTGAPGAGKSTLVGALIREARGRGTKVGVLAFDPSSPYTGGSVLGDRVRMVSGASDPHVFVRSVAARGHLGGLSSTASRIIDVLDAAGKDLIVVETVGVGQSETEVSRLAHVTVVLCAPGMGDDIQMIKAGILETADIFVVNKADHPDAHGLAQQLRAMLGLAGRDVPVMLTTATTADGVPPLLDAINAQARATDAAQERMTRLRRTLKGMCVREVERRLAAMPDDAMQRACDRILDREITLSEAALLLLHDVSR
jgi:LAO/AO transport system kinase